MLLAVSAASVVVVGSPPSTYYIARKADSVILASASEVPEWRDMAYDLMITTPSYASKNSKTTTAVATRSIWSASPRKPSAN